MRNKRVLFVGSFKDTANDGSVGGQMFACKSLINSELSLKIDWILIDTTGKSVPIPSRSYRAFFALIRLIKYIYFLIIKQPSTALIFAGSGASIYEKGLMVIIGKMFFKRIVFAPRGGGLFYEVRERFFFKFYLKHVLMKSNVIICQGTFWKDFFSTIVPAKHYDKMVVVPNWINLNAYRPTDFSVKQDNSKIISIVSMGWMEKEKGVQDLFEALLMLKLHSVKIKMIFLGDGTLRSDLIKRSSSLSDSSNIQFAFPGWVYSKDKVEYLQNADIFVLCSYFEGMPNSLIEAMSTKTACISSNVGAVSDLIENGKNGYLYQPGNIKELSEALQLLIDNIHLRAEFAEKAFNTVQEKNSIESAINIFSKIL